jgi:hypothetical protein
MSVCSAIGSIGCEAKKLSLSDVTEQGALDSVNHARLTDQVLSGIERALTMPGSKNFTGESSPGALGEPVAQEKAFLLSGVSSSEASPRSESGRGIGGHELEEKIHQMYVDMTSHMVAWRMAQRVQQDISHIMKG